MVELVDIILDKSGILFLGSCIIAHALILRWVEMNKKQVVLQVPATSTTQQQIPKIVAPVPVICKWCHERITEQEQYIMTKKGEPHCNYEQDQQVRAKRPIQQHTPQKKPVTNTSNSPKVVIPTPQKTNTPRPQPEQDNNA